jgi:glutamine synthetase
MSHPLVMLFISDLSGRMRGKSVPLQGSESLLKEGVGWIPANAVLTCFGPMAKVENDALGELRLIPAEEKPNSFFHKELKIAQNWWIGKIVRMDGFPWECCLRSQLESAMGLFRERFKLELQVGLEQEFYLTGGKDQLNTNSLEAFWEASDFLKIYAECLDSAGIAFKSLHAENGPGQYELSLPKMDPLQATDQLIMAKAIGRHCAFKMQENLTFSPIINTVTIGSGLHVHFSLKDLEGRDRNSVDGVRISMPAGAFLAGILGNLPSLTAFNSPSLISSERYSPPRWSAYFNNLGMMDRRAAIRITRLGSGSPDIHFELRTADACASPYLVLSSMIYAGIEGLGREMPCPPMHSTDELLSGLTIPGIERLPDSLEKSLGNLLENEALLSYFPAEFIDAYLTNKRHEITLSKDFKGQELYDQYIKCY